MCLLNAMEVDSQDVRGGWRRRKCGEKKVGQRMTSELHAAVTVHTERVREAQRAKRAGEKNFQLVKL